MHLNHGQPSFSISILHNFLFETETREFPRSLVRHVQFGTSRSMTTFDYVVTIKINVRFFLVFFPDRRSEGRDLFHQVFLDTFCSRLGAKRLNSKKNKR